MYGARGGELLVLFSFQEGKGREKGRKGRGVFCLRHADKELQEGDSDRG